jgi:hypothetical protein
MCTYFYVFYILNDLNQIYFTYYFESPRTKILTTPPIAVDATQIIILLYQYSIECPMNYDGTHT